MFHDNDFVDFLAVLGLATAASFAFIAAIGIPLTALNYYVSAEATVNAINEQCGTQYVKLDYLRLGEETMLKMCETRQKRIELIR